MILLRVQCHCHLKGELTISLIRLSYLQLQNNNNNNNDSHVDLEQSQSSNSITQQTTEIMTSTETVCISKSDFHSTALVRDVIQKTQFVESSREKVEETSSSSSSAANTTQKSYITSMNVKFSRESYGNSLERDDYDDAIEGYKNRVSKAAKSDLPKVNINERRDLFEIQQKEDKQNSSNNSTTTATAAISESISVNIKDRISAFNQNLQNSSAKSPPKEVEIPTSTKLKDRLMSLNQIVSPTVEPETDISRSMSSQFKQLELKSNNDDEKPNDDVNTPSTNEKPISHPYVTDLNQPNMNSAGMAMSNTVDDDHESADMESSVSCSQERHQISFLPLKLDNAMSSFANKFKKPSEIFNFIQSNLMDGN